MLKKRVIIQLLLRDGVLMRTKQFDGGNYRYTQSFLGSENADEVCIVDIERYDVIPPLRERKSFVDAACGYAKFCFTPLCVGGGIRTMDDVAFAFAEIGADKVLVNTEFHNELDFIGQLAGKYGAQAVVAGIDVDAKGYVTCDQNTTYGFQQEPMIWAQTCQKEGVGEVLLTSVDRDGSLRGYDLDLLRDVVAAVDVPVVIAGGCGGPHHMAEAFEAGADGAATSNIFHLTDTSLRSFKDQLLKKGAAVRP
jgi:cyclase